MEQRRFPPPWSLDEYTESFIVRDAAGQRLAYVYYDENPGRRSITQRLSKDEARRIANAIARLPKLMQQG